MPCFERTKISTKHSGCLSEASNFRHPLFGEAEQHGPWLMTPFHGATGDVSMSRVGSNLLLG